MSFWLDQMEKIVLADKEKRKKEQEEKNLAQDDFIDKVAECVVKKLTGSVIDVEVPENEPDENESDNDSENEE